MHFINNSPGDQYGKNQLSARYRISQFVFWDPLVKRIYQNIRNHSGPVVDIRCGEGSHFSDKVYSNHKVVDNFKKEFTRVEIEDVIYSVELNQEELKDVLAMTPMTWKISQPILDDFVHRTSTHTITVDLKIWCIVK